MSYRGLGQVCEEGEEFDLTSMMCVTAGQATSPVPTVPSFPDPSVPVPQPVPQLHPEAPPVTSVASTFDKYKPWIIGGGIALLGIIVLVSVSGGSRATANRSRRYKRPKWARLSIDKYQDVDRSYEKRVRSGKRRHKPGRGW